MPKPKSSPENYSQLSQELADVTARLEAGNLDIDEAVSCYERGLVLVKQLETYLAKTELHINILHAAHEQTKDSDDAVTVTAKPKPPRKSSASAIAGEE